MNTQPRELRERLMYVAAAVLLVTVMGTLGYIVLMPDHPSVIDALYQTVVIVTTLGMDPLKVGDQAATWQIKLFTMALIGIGAAVAAYGFTSLTAFVVEGELTNIIGRRRMDREIAKLRHHYIVCGAGRTGAYIIRELIKTRRPFVVIDTDEGVLRELASGAEVLYVVGDATEEAVLARAGLEHATGLLATLSNDRDNLFLVLTARHITPALKIIARGYELSAQEKLKRAGADSVVYPNLIGGMRMVSVMVRPAVVGFLDQMLRDSQQQVRFEEVVIHEGNRMIGKTLAESHIRQRTGLLVVACLVGEEEFTYNPSADTIIQQNMALVVLGETEQIQHLHALLEEPEGAQSPEHHIHLPHIPPPHVPSMHHDGAAHHEGSAHHEGAAHHQGAAHHDGAAHHEGSDLP